MVSDNAPAMVPQQPASPPQPVQTDSVQPAPAIEPQVATAPTPTTETTSYSDTQQPELMSAQAPMPAAQPVTTVDASASLPSSQPASTQPEEPKPFTPPQPIDRSDEPDYAQLLNDELDDSTSTLPPTPPAA